MKFLIDMPLSPALAQWLENQGHDAIHISALGMSRASDTEIIELAARETRTIITADLDYPRLLALAGASGPSLVLFRGGDWADKEIVARLAEILEGVTEVELERSILVVDRRRLRRRRLPVR